MKTSSTQRYLPALGLAALAVVGATLNAARANGPSLEPPRAQAGGYRLVVERLIQNLNLNTRFTPEGKIVQTPQHTVYLQMAVHPPEGRKAAGIHGLQGNLAARSDTGLEVVFRSYPQDNANPLKLNAWRTMLMASVVDVKATRIQRLSGTLKVYPQANVIRLEAPAAGPYPVVRMDQGVKLTLRECKVTGSRLRVELDVEWPGSLSVSGVSAQSPFGVATVSSSGAIGYPDGGGSSSSQGADGTEKRSFRLVFDQKKLPKAVVYEALVRGGEPELHPFTFTDIVLPDTLDFSVPPAPAGNDGAALAPKPGSLHFVVRTPQGPAKGGMVMVGLSARAGRKWGPWRWQEVAVRPNGEVIIPGLRPGAYRVIRRWTAAPSSQAATRTQSAQLLDEFTVRGGQQQRLTPFAIPASGRTGSAE